MSRIGRLPIKMPESVTTEKVGASVKVTGPKGSLELVLPANLEIEIKDGSIVVSNSSDTKQGRSMYGTYRSLLSNMVKGVADGWSKQLELVGTGYRAEVAGSKLTLNVGYSHPIVVDAPSGITFKVEKSIITIDGIDRHIVGQVAANIRKVRPPEPYKGKGILYKGEVVRRKAGKAAKTAGAAA